MMRVDEVSCYAGYRGEETPRRFVVSGRSVEVIEVLDRWLGPDHRYFKLRGDDGATYILRHDEHRGHGDRWELTLFERPTVDVEATPPWRPLPRHKA